MPPDDRISVLPSAHVLVSPQGELDLAAVDTLTCLLRRGSRLSARLIVDLHEVTFMDCTALTVLLRAHRRVVARGGGFVLVAPSRQVRRLLALTGTDDVWDVHDSLADALATWRLLPELLPHAHSS
jgi:anti-anti-sigma factor